MIAISGRRLSSDAMSTDPIPIGSGALQALVSPLGAELKNLRLHGDEWLWQGDPASWPRQAPVLFPYCGRCRDRVIRVKGTVFPNQPIHGFAPDSVFQVAEQTPDTLSLVLEDTPATRTLYPFTFRLMVNFSVRDRAFQQEIVVTNTGTETLPVSAGFHPGFRWPIPGQTDRQRHILRFEHHETAPVALPDSDGLMGGTTMPNPIRDSVLRLDDTLFHAGSAVFQNLKSRSLWYGVPGHPGLRLDFTTPHLVLWRWPGPGSADFLCIEPWAGLPDPAGFSGELREKPGMTLLPPGTDTKWGIILSLEA